RTSQDAPLGHGIGSRIHRLLRVDGSILAVRAAGGRGWGRSACVGARQPAPRWSHMALHASLDRRRRSRTLPQHELLDLAGRRLRQLAEDDLFRRFEAREVLAAMLDQVCFADVHAGLYLDERAWRLAPLLVRLRD